MISCPPSRLFSIAVQYARRIVHVSDFRALYFRVTARGSLTGGGDSELGCLLVGIITFCVHQGSSQASCGGHQLTPARNIFPKTRNYFSFQRVNCKS